MDTFIETHILGLNKKKESSRIVHINDEEQNSEYGYKSNYVKTAKYNVASFLPRALYEQFCRIGNLYFLIVGILSCTSVSPINPVSTCGPLVLVIGISLAKEAYEDIKRAQQDREVNKAPVQVLRSDAIAGDHKWQTVAWAEVKVGEIVKVLRNTPFPADLLVLWTPLEDGACYVETANLDGETNLKVKTSLQDTLDLQSEADALAFCGQVEADPPNNALYLLTGLLKFKGREALSEVIPLEPAQMVLRGSTLMNTEYIIGAVVYTGHDTKVMMNQIEAPTKRSEIEHGIDGVVVFMFMMLLTMCSFCAIAFAHLTQSKGGDMWYLEPFQIELYYDPDHSWLVGLANFVTTFILFGYLIPISLYVSIEMVKVAQTYFIDNDHKMYHRATDTPAHARTSNLNEELGQLQVVLSDKTGTLTCNMMELFKASIAGVQFGTAQFSEVERAREFRKSRMFLQPPMLAMEKGMNLRDSRLLRGAWWRLPEKLTVRAFVQVMACCHTAIPENNEGVITYQVESPDELAFVVGAKHLGMTFKKRTSSEMVVQEVLESGQLVDVKYKILAVLPFNSTRKRMSVVLREPSGTIRLLTKGADMMIFPRLAPDNEFKDITAQHMSEYAELGLRTLCLCSRLIQEEEFQAWEAHHKEARTAITGREEKVEAVAELIERDLVLHGSTAIEDKLQDGVPHAIERLRWAGIKVWVLTGDKTETAVQISRTAGLFTDDMRLHTITLEDVVQADSARGLLRQQIREADRAVREDTSGDHPDGHSLVVDGHALTDIFVQDLGDELLELGTKCRAVCISRVSPLQKAKVTALVRMGGYKCLAIGDGANDVGMIQEADVGVGISGMEGQQAVMASDFAVAQFRFLHRLVLHHGRHSYRRIGRLVAFFFYKNTALGFTLFWFNTDAFFSGQDLYNDNILAAFNIIFVAFPIIVVGILDQDLLPSTAEHFPALFQQGHRNEFFSWTVKGFWLLNGIFQSFVIYWFVLDAHLLTSDNDCGRVQDMYSVGMEMYTVIVLVVNLNLAMVINYWTWIHHVVIWGSIASWFVIIAIYSVMDIQISADAYHLYYWITAVTPHFWLTVTLTTTTCLIPDLCFRGLQRVFFWQDHHILQEVERGYGPTGGKVESIQSVHAMVQSVHTAMGVRQSIMEAPGRQSMAPASYGTLSSQSAKELNGPATNGKGKNGKGAPGIKEEEPLIN